MPDPNRLGAELSPYHKQHANNPVDWFPWGDEAIETARREDRPILLSIGYSACHWCHVMEHESFSDDETAKVMNERFVSIKVDREERPDLDQIYQTTVQLMGRSGGWPLTVFLTPKLEPFYAGTYFPPVERYGMPSFRTVLLAVHDAFTNRRKDVETSASELTRAIAEVTAGERDASDPPGDLLARAVTRVAPRIDDVHGGFGDRPKFPNTMALEVLLRAHRATGDEAPLRKVLRALDAMREGGIYDHLGGGFHRYSTDERWLVPHFEKMLYDNALLARLYTDAFKLTKEPRFAETVRETLDYVEREMLSPEGLFYSTQDADSEGEEGKFFVWTPDEIVGVLGRGDAEVFARAYGVTEGGNFEHGTTVLSVARPLATVAREIGETDEETRAVLARAKRALFLAREARVKPFRDEKIIAAWNGLAIGAFAHAGAALGEARYVGIARRALDGVERLLWRDGILLRIAMGDVAKIEAFLEDHGDLACAALDVHEATMDDGALGLARALADAALERFYDEESGSFFFASEGRSDLVVRTKDAYDNAVPSGTSAITHALLRLNELAPNPRYAEAAERQIRALTKSAMDNPLGYGHLIGAMDRYVAGATTVVVVGERDDARTRALLDAARRPYVPNLVLASVTRGDRESGPAALLEGRTMEGGAPTAYVCRRRACGLPITDPSALEADLAR
jgi:uncharacterized protein YyaL (SSP411 family)